MMGIGSRTTSSTESARIGRSNGMGEDETRSATDDDG